MRQFTSGNNVLPFSFTVMYRSRRLKIGLVAILAGSEALINGSDCDAAGSISIQASPQNLHRERHNRMIPFQGIQQ
ncbi:MAG TPA: hypothetical protein VMJ33_12135 [Gallionella sp.]|nr:hypothetical protein [Gallionella sp.]